MLAAGRVVPQCMQGCLKCTADNACLVCDLELSYTMLNGICQQTYQINCLLLAPNGPCLICSKDFYFKPDTKTCTAVATVVPNCVVYADAGTCGQCATGFVPSADKKSCQAIVVPNCAYSFTDAAACSVCQSGFVLDLARGCVAKPPALANCAVASRARCNSCAANFVLNDQLQQTSYLSTFQQTSDFVAQLTFLLRASTNTLLPQICEPNTAGLCADWASGSECRSCLPDLAYLDPFTRKCVAFPYFTINKCLRYADRYVCLECESGFVLKASPFPASSRANDCVPIEGRIDYCYQYDGSLSFMQCRVCQITHYINDQTTPKTCVLRTPIANCKLYQENYDKCSAC